MTKKAIESPKPGTSPRKLLAPREAHFAKLMAETGMGSIEAHRIAFGSRCEPNSKESQHARDLARSARVKNEVKRIKNKGIEEEAAKIAMKQEFGDLDKGQLREYAFKTLSKLRDTSKQSTVRFNAIRVLKKIHDPGKDVNLIYKWMDLAWRYQTAHCPACHNNFPLANVKNQFLETWRKRNKADEVQTVLPNRFARQMELIKRADKRRTPHPGQVEVLSAPERHIVGRGAARGGKSWLLALFATLGFCLPGVEIWILAETYDRASKEVEYLQRFLNALFYPHFNQLVRVNQDKKTGETIITSKWGSEVRVKSAKAKGSITGHALEFALIAEPGWLPADIYEELRARMSERLGRIIALGTPKGVGGFVGRLTNMSGRDPKTNKIVRWKKEDRLIENGADWNISMKVIQMNPEDNPEYVKQELGAARMELTDEEYASEFEGLGVSAEGAKFSLVKQHHLRIVDPFYFERAVFVLGIDQGQKNFGVCLSAFDGHQIVPCWEYFNSDSTTTMKRNLLNLRSRVPGWINTLGGNPANWLLTIADRDPNLDTIFSEIEEEGLRWPTDIVVRHQNMAKLQENWRRETQEFVNNMAKRDRLVFHSMEDVLIAVDDNEAPGAYQLHDQVMQTIDVAEDPDRESKAGNTKGWQVSDPWRGDHILDAWYLTMWTILSQQLRVPEDRAPANSNDPWADQKRAFEIALKKNEERELRAWDNKRGQREPANAQEAYRGLRGRGTIPLPPGPYGDQA